LKISASSRRSTLVLLALLGGGAVDLEAQRVAVTGRLYHGRRAATPLARAWVVLHEVSMGRRGGPIDSVRSDARGAYALAIAHPVWAGARPRRGIQLRAGQGALSRRAGARNGDAVAAFAPIPPGDPKQLTYAYVLPADADHVAIPIDQRTTEVDLLVEDTTAT